MSIHHFEQKKDLLILKKKSINNLFSCSFEKVKVDFILTRLNSEYEN